MAKNKGDRVTRTHRSEYPVDKNAMCGKKKAYKSIKAARIEAGRYNKHFRVYECPICHSYHTTTEKGLDQ